MSRSARSARLGASLVQLGLEAQTVIALRMWKLALGGGDDVGREVQRMVDEKIDAAIVAHGHLAAGLLTGALAAGQQRAVTHLRRKVRANRRRLSR